MVEMVIVNGDIKKTSLDILTTTMARIEDTMNLTYRNLIFYKKQIDKNIRIKAWYFCEVKNMRKLKEMKAIVKKELIRRDEWKNWKDIF